jgi:hypothetical protein
MADRRSAKVRRVGRTEWATISPVPCTPPVQGGPRHTEPCWVFLMVVPRSHRAMQPVADPFDVTPRSDRTSRGSCEPRAPAAPVWGILGGRPARGASAIAARAADPTSAWALRSGPFGAGCEPWVIWLK